MCCPACPWPGVTWAAKSSLRRGAQHQIKLSKGNLISASTPGTKYRKDCHNIQPSWTIKMLPEKEWLSGTGESTKIPNLPNFCPPHRGLLSAAKVVSADYRYTPGEKEKNLALRQEDLDLRCQCCYIGWARAITGHAQARLSGTSGENRKNSSTCELSQEGGKCKKKNQNLAASFG